MDERELHLAEDAAYALVAQKPLMTHLRQRVISTALDVISSTGPDEAGKREDQYQAVRAFNELMALLESMARNAEDRRER